MLQFLHYRIQIINQMQHSIILTVTLNCSVLLTTTKKQIVISCWELQLNSILKLSWSNLEYNLQGAHTQYLALFKTLINYSQHPSNVSVTNEKRLANRLTDSSAISHPLISMKNPFIIVKFMYCFLDLFQWCNQSNKAENS